MTRKKTTKLIAGLFLSAVLVHALYGCGDSSNETAKAETTTQAITTEATTEAATEAVTEAAPEDDTVTGEEGESKEFTFTNDEENGLTINEVTSEE